MKTYEEIIASGIDLQLYENHRQLAVQKSKKGFLTAAIVGGAIVLAGIILIFVTGPFGFFLAFGGLTVFFVWWAITNSNAKSDLKKNIYSDLVKKIDPNLNYFTNSRLLSELFRKSGLIKSYSTVTGDDGFEGLYNDYKFGFVEAHAQQKSNKSTHTVFKGPFYWIDTQGQYPFTSIIPDELEKSFGSFGATLSKLNLARLNQKNIRIEEDPEFEKRFAVWTKDENFARQVLTPQVRNFLMSISSIHTIYLGFRDNYVFVAIDNRQDLFEIKFKEPVSEEIVKKFYKDFMTYFSVLQEVINVLPLNKPV